MKIMKIKHTFGEKFTLDVGGIEFEKGKIIGLVGENGAGKTTFMSIISGYLKANKIYEVQVEDDNYEILYIPSYIKIYDFLKVVEFVRLYVKYSKCTLSVEEIIKLIGLEGKEECDIDELSEGMRKKITLIPVFTSDADLIIMDEPFNSIDMKYIYNLKKYIKSRKNCCFLISSHIVDTLSDMCDKCIVLENGKIGKIIDNIDDKLSLEEQIFEKNNSI